MSVNIPLKRQFSSITNVMKPSAIRLLLKITEDPEIISFGGGLPNPDSFPIREVKKIFDSLIVKNGKKALQYGATGGLVSLNIALAKRLQDIEKIECGPENVIQTTGSQEALYMIGKMFADRGDYIISEVPTYTGAITAFRANEIRMIGVEMDHYGMKMDQLRMMLKKYPNPRFIYVIPNYQNPSGITMSIERRRELMEICEEKGITIVEDDPYGSLRFAGPHLPTLKSMDKNGIVVYLGTFSKILAPGLRLGYTVATPEIIEKLNLVKQAVDLSTSTLSEYIAEAYLSQGLIDKQIPKIVELYKGKKKLMIESFKNYFPEDVEYTRPNGGMFIWVTRKGYDTDKLFPLAMKKKVVYVVGSAFYPNGDNHESMRLNFTYSSNERIIEGVKRLGEIFREASLS